MRLAKGEEDDRQTEEEHADHGRGAENPGALSRSCQGSETGMPTPKPVVMPL